MAGVLAVPNQTRASLTRTTRDGRELFYQISIIQQPERARACGSGAKSSADRRPVDPPPVVELKIFEGAEKNDVTFSHNANFFLFTTLEPARQINHGRVPVAPSSAPVLTGAPVAGMVYLDRPSPAGYFIFPDLSVRHEGMYRLSFSLYEDVKEEKDEDPKTSEDIPTAKAKNGMPPRGHVHFRLEVKSEAFSVFSAKKFPGLAESTNLSRTVAEQGCRVRIRREVRMRRREKGMDGYPNEENCYPSSDRYSTPQQMPDRPRSMSSASMDAATPYSIGRRPSNHESTTTSYYAPNGYPQSHPPPPPPPPPPIPPAPLNTTPSSTSHLNFGAGSSTPTYSKPPIPAPPSPALPPTNSQRFPSSSSSYSQYPSSMHSRQTSAPQNYSYSQAPQQSGSFGPTQSYKDSYQPQTDSRRTSLIDEAPGPSYEGPSSSSSSLDHSGPGHHMYGNAHGNVQSGMSSHGPGHPPLSRALTPINTNHQNHHSNHQNNNILPSVTSLLQDNLVDQKTDIVPVSSSMPHGPHNPYSSSSRPGYTPTTITPSSANSTFSPDLNPPRLQPPYSANGDQTSSGKRAYGRVFDTSHFNQPQHGGSRPSPLYHAQDIQKIETDDGDVQDLYEDTRNTTLIYKRANGSQQARKCPSPRDRRR